MRDTIKAIRAFNSEFSELIQPALDSLPMDVRTRAIYDYYDVMEKFDRDSKDIHKILERTKLVFLWTEDVCRAAVNFVPDIANKLRVLTYIKILRTMAKSEYNIDI